MPSVVRSRLAPARRALGLVVIMVLLACAVAFYRVAPGLPASPKPARTSATPATSVTPSPTASQGAPSPSVTSPTRPGARAPSRPTASFPTDPEPTAGIYLLARRPATAADAPSVRALDKPVSTLDLRLPPVSQGGNEFRSLHPSATQVQASADRQPVVIPDAQIRGDISLPLVMPATKFELRYRLKGVTVRSMRSVPGRAIAALGPVTAGCRQTHP